MTLSDCLYILFHPSLWNQNYPTNMEWDAKLNALMEENEFIRTGSHTASIGGISLWVSNHPYASFNPILEGGAELKILPAKMTRVKAGKALLSCDLAQLDQQLTEVEPIPAYYR